MYDIKQFRPALYCCLLLGLTGFSFAVESPGLWVVGCAVIVLQAWLVRSGRYRPLPRWVANSVTVLALFVTFQLIRSATTPIVTIGQFLVFLQLVKLFELRANRDYAQLLGWQIDHPGARRGGWTRRAARSRCRSNRPG
jgi:hypothetical protein